MRQGGFEDAGPDARDPKNYTWGMSALLAGPDAKRYKAAKIVGNDFGFTDRLDYIFYRNGVKVLSSKIVGNTWPQGSTWDCSNEEQVNNAVEIADLMKIKVPNENFCNDTDHASVVAKVLIPTNSVQSAPLPDHAPFPISFWNLIGIAVAALTAALIALKVRRRKR